MVQLCILLDIHTGVYWNRTVHLTEWVATMDDIVVEFKHGMSGGDSIQTEPRGRWGSPASGIKITWQHYQCVKYYCQRGVRSHVPRCRTIIRVNAMKASSWGMVLHVYMPTTAFRTDWILCHWRYSNTQHTPWSYCCAIFINLES
jgi:hypothetical protein